MFSGIVRHIPIALSVVAVMGAAWALPGNVAAADPDQDQKFFDLLGQKDIPPVDGNDDLIITAHKVCTKLDGGMPVGDMVELIRNNGFNDNPLTRLQNPARVTRTIDRFITAAVQAYCPHNQGKIASIAGYQPSHGTSARAMLVSFVGPMPAGEIAPTKPLPVPAKQMPPEEVQPKPQEPPPPPRRVEKAPQQAPKQAEPAPQQAPPAEAPPPPEVEPPPPPAAPAPPAPAAPEPPPPAPPPPEPPAPAPAPGHIRLAP